MNDKALAVGPTAVALVLFAPGRKAGRSSSRPNKLQGDPEVKSFVMGEVSRRVPIRVWQTHSWAKKIVERRPRNGVEKGRISRPGKS